jgi:hypothetical protein
VPVELKSLPKNLVDAAKQRRLIPLVGAGFSKQSGSPFPSWRELLELLKDRATQQSHISDSEANDIRRLLTRDQYLMVAEDLRFKLPLDEYETFLKDAFDPPNAEPAEAHRQLFRINPPLILTTNYDRLLEDAFASRYERAATVYTYKDAPAVQQVLQRGNPSGRPVIFKLHGSIDAVNEVILSERDYRKLLYENPGYRLVLSALFVAYVVVFIGFSFGDPELRLLLEQHRESLKHRSSPDFIFLANDACSAVERRRLREDFGLQVISYDATDGHPEVHAFVSYLADIADATK